MNRPSRPLFTFLFSLFTAALCAASPFSPLQIGLDGEDLQLVDAHTPVIGLRLNLPVSGNDDVGGLDVGVASYANTFSGLRLNLWSWTKGPVNGLEMSLCTMAMENLNGIHVSGLGIVALEMRGIQAGLVSYAGTLRGLQIALWPTASDLFGLQLGLANFSDTSRGLQLGIFNSSGTLHGLQIGLVNRAETLHGLQLGLLNIVPDSPLPVLPLLRASF